MRQHILCVGTSSVDVTLWPVNSWPQPGGRIIPQHYLVLSGGNAVNVACGVAATGHDATILLCCGNDYFGSMMQSELASLPIEIIPALKPSSTSLSIVCVSQNGDRQFISQLGANSDLVPMDIADAISRSRPTIIVLAGFVLMRNLITPKFSAALSRILSDAEAIIVADPGFREDWTQTDWEIPLRELLPSIDYFVPSWLEAVAISGMNEINSIITYLRYLGAQGICLKNGSVGCFGVDQQSNEIFHCPAEKVNVVDTTGAGDAWCAGFSAALLEQQDFLTTLKRANELAAQCITKPGTVIKSFGLSS